MCTFVVNLPLPVEISPHLKNFTILKNLCKNRIKMSALCDPDLDIKIKRGTERISENMHIVANEPSLAFYRLQEHIRKAMPGMIQKRVDFNILQEELKGSCYDVEYALSLMKCTDAAGKMLRSSREHLKNAVFLRQQLKYEENKKNKKDPQSAFKRLSAHITLDFSDLPEALRETASKVESIMTQARYASSCDTSVALNGKKSAELG